MAARVVLSVDQGFLHAGQTLSQGWILPCVVGKGPVHPYPESVVSWCAVRCLIWRVSICLLFVLTSFVTVLIRKSLPVPGSPGVYPAFFSSNINFEGILLCCKNKSRNVLFLFWKCRVKVLWTLASSTPQRIMSALRTRVSTGFIPCS